MKKNKGLLKVLIATITTVGIISGTSLTTTASELLYEFDVISDTHVKDGGDTSINNTALALNSIKNSYPDDLCIVINGDVVDDNKSESYSTLHNIIDCIDDCDANPTYNPDPANDDNERLPYIYFNFGNHELRPNASSSSSNLDTNLSKFFTNTRKIQQGLTDADYITTNDRDTDKSYDVQYVNGNTIFFFLGTDSIYGDCANISNGQLAFLKQKIKDSQGEPMFIFCHQPLQGTVYGSDEANCIRKNNDEILNLLEENPNVIMFTSHTHESFEKHDFSVGQNFDNGSKNHAHIFSTSSIMNDWGGDGDPEGLHVKVYNNKVVVQGVELDENDDTDPICSKTISLD